MRLLNSMGQVVSMQKSVGASPVEFVTQDLMAGMYIVDFQSEDVRRTKKVVVQH